MYGMFRIRISRKTLPAVRRAEAPDLYGNLTPFWGQALCLFIRYQSRIILPSASKLYRPAGFKPLAFASVITTLEFL